MAGMQKYNILIASSERTEILAEKLRDQLETDYSVAKLWRMNVVRGQPTETIIEILEGSTEEYDFAAIVLDESDVNVNMESVQLRDRDNCFFELGFFLAAFGRERCFIINSNERPYLPLDLGGIKALRFKKPDPDRLHNREACADAMLSVSSQIKDSIGKVKKDKNKPLSKEKLLDREQKRPDGELLEDHIVVYETQPSEIDYTTAYQIRKNMDAGIEYAYCFHGGLDCVERLCRLLQKLLVAPMLNDEEREDYSKRKMKLLQEDTQNKIVEELIKISKGQHLKIYLLPNRPELEYVIHNAKSATDAVLYIKHKDTFILWERGDSAHKTWAEVKARLGDCVYLSNAVFCGASGFNIKEDAFFKILKREMRKAFPGIDEENLINICCDG